MNISLTGTKVPHMNLIDLSKQGKEKTCMALLEAPEWRTFYRLLERARSSQLIGGRRLDFMRRVRGSI